ncbi:hypothetical protein [Vibrio splendidus]|uniref:hypothetical protein n=1 Tax=Vibrio splendidus TaxID=29497 RepID=UPI001E47B926|nr:hypothetical protein [Vibrio splendidus]MCC4859758.1 hypothetical protein [Vibrio splendidus]
MIKEVTNSIKATLYQRVNSPIYGTYIFTWCIYNWERLLKFVFGEGDFNIRLDAFKTSMYIGDDFQYELIFYPVLATAMILFFQPLMLRYLFIYSEWNKSEGLKKRDVFTSETMLTLEQSNEIRSQMQKVHEFNQKIIENKNSEITELNSQVEHVTSSKLGLEKENVKNVTLIIEKDNQLSEMSLQLTTLEGDFSKLNSKYLRLFKILKRQRNITRNKVSVINDWYVSKKFSDGFPEFVGVINETPNEFEIRQIINLSNVSEWRKACYFNLIYRFSRSSSFDNADYNFDTLIEPFLNDFDEDGLHLLLSLMRNNGQITDRRRAESDLLKVKSALEKTQVAA